MRTVIPFNRDWLFEREFRPEFALDDFDDSAFETVQLPHTNREIPYNYANENVSQFISCYRKHFLLPPEYEGKRIALKFDGAAHYAGVFVNGHEVGEHKGGYTAFELDITKQVRFDRENCVTVMLDSRERNDIPPFGYVIDYLTYGGLYREVSLIVTDRSYIADVFVHASRVLQSQPQIHVELSIAGNTAGCRCAVTIEGITREQDAAREMEFILDGTRLKRWDLDAPVLHTAQISLKRGETLIDSVSERFGVREAVFKTDGFYLNGKKIKLLGLNRHQSYPYVGYAMPKSQQYRDAEILKNELGVRIVRTSHYPQSQHFINRCDELGLLVFTEIPGWQHIGNEDWQITAVRHTEEMVTQYRNHPSIILWGVRINESQDNDAFYAQTNKTARILDKTRQTGGVRYIKHSSLLEDVYTYNDFIHSGRNRGLDPPNRVTGQKKAPYLVTEHNGHKYPTKRFDDERHRLSQALRHCAVIQDMYANRRISGAIGWCMCDYNTHKDFGSGDGICYHGVMDMFRIKKLAASVYASQQNTGDIMETSSTMNIGEHPDSMLGDIYAFSNMDSIRLYRNNEFINEFFPNRAEFPALPHPPFSLNDIIGNQLVSKEHMKPGTAKMVREVMIAITRSGQKKIPFTIMLKAFWLFASRTITMKQAMSLYGTYVGNWGDRQVSYRFEGIKNNAVVKTITQEPVRKTCLRVTPDSNALHEKETYDVVRIVLEAIDQNGNVLPYYQEAVSVSVSGPAAVIGPRIVSLKGGAAAFYVKSCGKNGKAVVTIQTQDNGLYTVDLDCRAVIS